MFRPQAVYHLATHRLTGCETMANLSTTSNFWDAISNHFKEMSREDPDEFAYAAVDANFVQDVTLAQLDHLKELNPWFETDENFIGAYFQKKFCEALNREN